MLVLEKQEKIDVQQFYAIVQLIGTRKQAESFAYRYGGNYPCNLEGLRGGATHSPNRQWLMYHLFG
jgi:hypothetical protein